MTNPAVGTGLGICDRHGGGCVEASAPSLDGPDQVEVLLEVEDRYGGDLVV